jgi:threonine dehydratase
MPLWIETPLIESVPMGLPIGKKIRLKLENVQPAGSFKLRESSALRGRSCAWRKGVYLRNHRKRRIRARLGGA